MSETMIKIDHVSKEYRLGAIGGGTLRGDLQSWWARVRGKEDPNLQIGQQTYIGNERFLALDDISFEVKKGEALGIIGHNGAGKSTLLKLLSRVTAPSGGTISYNGRIASMLEVGTGFHPELTGRENVYMNGAILGMTKAEIARKFDDIVAFAEMEKFIDTPVKRYSSGMYVKLAFSVAAHLDSEIMIMDEVLAVGDMAFQKKCLDKMRDAANKEGRTVLYVSHNMNTIRQLCDRCVVLDKGHVVFDGDVEEAIGVYLGNKSNKSCHYIYHDGYHSDGRSKSTGFLINELSILDNEGASFNIEQNIKMIIKCYSSKKYENLFLRYEIQTINGQAIATALTEDSFCISENMSKEICLVFTMKNLVPGKYRANIIAFLIDEFGTERYIDGVYPGFEFDIIKMESREHNNLIWNPLYWGNVRLENIRIMR